MPFCTLVLALGLGDVRLMDGEVTERSEDEEVDFEMEFSALVGAARRGGVIETIRVRGEVDKAESTGGDFT